MLSLRRVNVGQVLSWQEDKLYFRAEPLASIARSLERQFNVDIAIADERLRKICFTGEFVDGENIQEIMQIISAVSSSGAAKTISNFTETDKYSPNYFTTT